MKINAYLEQVLGFTNVSRLAGGIISYTRELEQQKLKEELEQENINLTKNNEKIDREDEDSGFTMISKSENTDLSDKSGSAGSGAGSGAGAHFTRNVVGSKFRVRMFCFIAKTF